MEYKLKLHMKKIKLFLLWIFLLKGEAIDGKFLFNIFAAIIYCCVYCPRQGVKLYPSSVLINNQKAILHTKS